MMSEEKVTYVAGQVVNLEDVLSHEEMALLKDLFLQNEEIEAQIFQLQCKHEQVTKKIQGLIRRKLNVYDDYWRINHSVDGSWMIHFAGRKW